mgnify:FL=1
MNGYNPYYGYQPYSPPVPDQLAQLRYNQGMQQGIQQGFQGFGQQQNSDERIWVQGKNAAEAYLVAANGFVRLWDSNGQVFYEKRADASGRPCMETYEYKRLGAELPKTESENKSSVNDYSKEIDSLKARLAALEKRLNDGGRANANVSESNANDSAVSAI